MKSVRLHTSARIVTAACLMISWFVATNHCAFGLMKPTAQAGAEHSHCHGGKPAPGRNAPADGTRECCKAIHAVPVTAKVEAKVGATDFPLFVFALIEALAGKIAGQSTVTFIFDHGPPRALSFAESVLQRSLLGHAPPLV